MSTIKEGLYYSEDHEWVAVEGNVATIGLSDFAQHELGDIVFVEMPEEDDDLEAGGELGTVESVKAASDIYSPVSGKVVAINEDLEDEPGKINAEPYDAWIVKVELSDTAELEKLLSPDGYKAFIEE